MADTSLRRELDAIAMDLEQKGHSKLASIVDICNHEIHTRKASVKPSKKAEKPTRAASTPAKPKRRPQPKRSVTSAARIAGAARALKDVRWARKELRDIAREYRKLGSVVEARQLLRMAEELAEDETELMEVAGPVVDVDNAVEGEDIDLDTPVEDEASEDEYEGVYEELLDSQECVCEDESTEEYDEEAPETYEDDVEAEPVLATVAACAKEIRAIARELRREGDHRNASIMTRLACECENMAEPVTVIPLPPTDGGAPPIDSTDFALGDDENLLDFAVEVVQDGEPEEHVNEFAPETSEEAIEDEVAPDESKAAEEYLTASASLKRTAKALQSEGLGNDAKKLLRKAYAYDSIAKKRQAAAKPAKR